MKHRCGVKVQVHLRGWVTITNPRYFEYGDCKCRTFRIAKGE